MSRLTECVQDVYTNWRAAADEAWDHGWRPPTGSSTRHLKCCDWAHAVGLLSVDEARVLFGDESLKSSSTGPDMANPDPGMSIGGQMIQMKSAASWQRCQLRIALLLVCMAKMSESPNSEAEARQK